MREQCEADIAHAMSSIAKQSIFAVDHSKFSSDSAQNMVQITGLDGNLQLVCDKGLNKEYTNLLSSFKVSLVD